MAFKGMENVEVLLINYIFGSIKYIEMTEGVCHSTKHESSQCYLVRDSV